MSRYAFDLEANGLLWDATTIHCLVLKDLDTGEIKKFTPSEVEQGLTVLSQASLIVGHNVIQYDLALAGKLYPGISFDGAEVVDTLVLSRFLYTNLSDLDRERNAIDAKLFGSHSLKAWGQRLSFEKDEYEGGWETYSEAMLEYNVRDVEVTDRLWQVLLQSPGYSEKVSRIEHEIATNASLQERRGFAFDRRAAERLNGELLAKQSELEARLQDTFPPFFLPDGPVVTPKVNNAKRGTTKGEPYCKIKLTDFNPGSRHHIAFRLKAKYGWTPDKFTPAGAPVVDEPVLASLKYPEAQLMAEYLMIQKRLGMINSYLTLEREGRLHGEVLTGGTVTGRCAHRNPNLGQVPAVGAPYGKDFRSLFVTSPGNVLVGCDMSGLELRMLAHYMNDPGYTKALLEEDIHTVNQHAAGLPTRNDAKTFIYALLYGAGNAKLGSIIGKGPQQGASLRRRFMTNLPAFERLMTAVAKAAKRGYLMGLDGRRLHIRSEHAALNTLLQAAGAVCSKVWVNRFDAAIQERGWGDKVYHVAYVHDELQIEAPKELADEVGKLAVDCIRQAGVDLGVTVPLTGEYKIGSNWAETH